MRLYGPSAVDGYVQPMFTSRPSRRVAWVGALAATCLAFALVSCSSDSGGDASSATASTDNTTTTADLSGQAEANGGGEDGGGTIKVLTYNVAGLPIEISKEHPDVNIPLISPKLKDYDVVLTQESFDWWKPGGLAAGLDFTHYLERLRAGTDQKYHTPVHPGPEAVDLAEDRRADLQIGDGLNVLSRYPISDTVRVPWTRCFGGLDTSDHGAADCLAMKGFLVTEMKLADGSTVDLYDLHGEAGGSTTDQELQAADFVQLADYIDAHSKGHAVILAGDTNLHTEEAGPDAHEDSGGGADLVIWTRFLDATGLTDSCDATSCEDTGRIDKVAFRSGAGVDLAVLDYGVEGDTFVDAAGKDLSDHQPVAVTFRWTPA